MKMNESLYCIGCGAKIQSQDASHEGYIPAAALEKNLENDQDVYCQRCFRLRQYNEVTDIDLDENAFLQLLNELNQEPALIVHVVNILDFNASLISGIHRFAGKNEILLVANKSDLLPKSVKLNRLRHWAEQGAYANGIKPVETLVTSAKDQDSILKLMDAIEKHRQGRDVYVVGATNVGKSTIINAIIKAASAEENLITTSYFPGTTLGKIHIPLDDGSEIIDTPGLIQKGQMTGLLDLEDIKPVTIKKPIKPRGYQISSGQTLFIGGLARIDLEGIEGKQPVIIYASNDLPIHRTKTEKASELYEKQVGELLTPPSRGQENFPPLRPRTIQVKEESDLSIAGLGWVKLPGPCQLTVWTPQEVKLFQRQPMI